MVPLLERIPIYNELRELAVTPETWYPAKDIPRIFNEAGIPSPTGIEIGVCFGMSTLWLLDEIPMLKLYGVDPYVPYYQMNFRDVAFETMLKFTAPYGDRFFLYKETSDDAVSHFEDDSVDFVFIDGLHTQEQVTKDFYNYYPKIRKGGFIFGHDYTGYGLHESVDKFAAEIGKEVLTCEQDVWYWRKT